MDSGRVGVGLSIAGVGLAAVSMYGPTVIPVSELSARIGFGIGMVMCVAGVAFIAWPRGHKSASEIDLQTIDRRDLKTRAIKLANEIRAEDAAHHAKGNALLLDMKRDFDARTEASFAARQSWEAEFKRRFRPDLMALADEICRRLGVPTSGESSPNAMNFAMFAGPHPATEAADYLDSLARRLG